MYIICKHEWFKIAKVNIGGKFNFCRAVKGTLLLSFWFVITVSTKFHIRWKLDKFEADMEATKRWLPCWQYHIQVNRTWIGSCLQCLLRMIFYLYIVFYIFYISISSLDWVARKNVSQEQFLHLSWLVILNINNFSFFNFINSKLHKLTRLGTNVK